MDAFRRHYDVLCFGGRCVELEGADVPGFVRLGVSQLHLFL